jgi:hypothetical protein
VEKSRRTRESSGDPATAETLKRLTPGALLGDTTPPDRALSIRHWSGRCAEAILE